MLTAPHQKSLRMGMDDDLAQRLPRGGRCLDCGAILTETSQLTEETSWIGRSHFLKFVRVHKEDAKETSLSRRSFFLKFVRIYKEDADDSCVALWRFIRINWEINTYYFSD